MWTFSPQKCPVKALELQLWSGRHALLHHHRGKRAGPHFTLYHGKYPSIHPSIDPLVSIYSSIHPCIHGFDILFPRLFLRPSRKPASTLRTLVWRTAWTSFGRLIGNLSERWWWTESSSTGMTVEVMDKWLGPLKSQIGCAVTDCDLAVSEVRTTGSWNIMYM